MFAPSAEEPSGGLVQIETGDEIQPSPPEPGWPIISQLLFFETGSQTLNTDSNVAGLHSKR